MFDFLYKGPLGRHNIIKEVVEDECDAYLERIYETQGSFYMSFFEECINSTIADAYEYFAELRINGNVLGENVYEMTKEKGRRFILSFLSQIKLPEDIKLTVDVDPIDIL